PVGFGLTLYRHREHGSAVMLVKEQRSDRFGAGSRARRREHQPFGRSDVAVDTDEGMSQPIGALMNKSEGAVGPQIDLTHGEGNPLRIPPQRDMLWLGPRLENERPWCVKASGDDDLSVGRCGDRRVS